MNYASAVTVNITSGTGTPGAAITGGAQMGMPINGVVTIGSIGITTAGTNYALTATSGALSTTSGAFDIAAGAANRLVFTVQPSDATTGSAVFPTVELTAVDVFGNVATSFGANVERVDRAEPVGRRDWYPDQWGSHTSTAVSGVARFDQIGNTIGSRLLGMATRCWPRRQ